MKLIKQIFITLLTAVTLFCCVMFSACGNDNKGKASVGEWNADEQFFSGLPLNLGVPMTYEYANADIEICNVSKQAHLWLTRFENYDNDNNFIIGETKGISHNDCPYKFEGRMLVQWLPVGGDVWQERRDYITFKAKIDNEIVGYAVIYVWTDGKTGNGKVLVDRECKNTNEESVNEKIQEVINNHKSAQ